MPTEYRMMQKPMESKKSMIIIINIDELIRDLLGWLIRAAGHDVRTYDSGLDYLDDAARDDRPDCVILDTHMLGISGLEMYGILKTQYPNLPVIFITGYPDHTIAEKSRALESQGFFTRPLDTNAILNCIDGAIASSGA